MVNNILLVPDSTISEWEQAVHEVVLVQDNHGATQSTHAPDAESKNWVDVHACWLRFKIIPNKNESSNMKCFIFKGHILFKVLLENYFKVIFSFKFLNKSLIDKCYYLELN